MEKCVPNVQKWLFRNLEIKRQQSATREMDAFLFVAFKTYLFQRGGSDNSDILLVLFPLQSAAFQAHSIWKQASMQVWNIKEEIQFESCLYRILIPC